MSARIQAIRGMHDILPQDSPRWQQVEACARALLARYAYREIRMPLVEKTDLFKRSIGEVTDIVEKEMYTFEDRNGESLSLRPEGTASCVRAGVEHGLLHNQQQRLWYAGPMFRHERPQKGRLRQFHQIGVEAFGMPGPDIDAELIATSARLWQELGIADIVTLEINTLGSSQERATYRHALVDYLRAHEPRLDDDSRRRLYTNPLRVLDSKVAETQQVLEQAPRLQEYLEAASRRHFDDLRQRLGDIGIDSRVNPRLVRGLDYYSHAVYEWTTDRLGAQGTVCAGGRYDALVEQLGGRATPAAGYAIGLERVVALLEDRDPGAVTYAPQVYLVSAGEQAERFAWGLAERLRSRYPTLRLQLNCGGGSLKTQLKRADRSGADVALVIGDQEMERKDFGWKPLRSGAEQEHLSEAELEVRLSQTVKDTT